jgi:hypothetical protein
MSLTRRLYRFDEVRSAFLYAIKSRRFSEAIVWLDELEDSLYSGEARRLLLLAWILQVGLAKLSWLVEWSNNGHTREGRIRLCWQLMKCQERDSSIWLLLWSLPCKEEDQTLVGSLEQKWAQAMQLEEEIFWEQMLESTEEEAICTIFEQLQTSMNSYSVFAKCTALAVTECLNKLPKTTWTPLSDSEPSDLLNERKGWKTGNLRTDRLVSVPYDCLFGMTWRGSGNSTEEELKNLSLTEFLKSPCWRSILKPFLNLEGTGWKSDEELGLFWDTYFNFIKSDHPDEWSKQDRNKSHGTGVTHPGASLSRWWKNWIPSEHLFIWGKTQITIHKKIQNLNGMLNGASILDTLLEMYKQLDLEKDFDTISSKRKEFHFET